MSVNEVQGFKSKDLKKLPKEGICIQKWYQILPNPPVCLVSSWILDLPAAEIPLFLNLPLHLVYSLRLPLLLTPLSLPFSPSPIPFHSASLSLLHLFHLLFIEPTKFITQEHFCFFLSHHSPFFLTEDSSNKDLNLP